MLTYDSLSFIQEAIVLWVVLALAATLGAVHAKASESPSSTPAI
jgi:hypothetical protein